MQTSVKQGLYSSQEQYSFPQHGINNWFPSHPDCPNHKAGAQFSSDYTHPNENGDVSCPECFLSSTIMQSVANMSCPHLHACSNCTNCYSHVNDRSSASGVSPPLFSSYSGSRQPGISPPLVQQEGKPAYGPRRYHEMSSLSPHRSNSVTLSASSEYEKYTLRDQPYHQSHSTPASPCYGSVSQQSVRLSSNTFPYKSNHMPVNGQYISHSSPETLSVSPTSEYHCHDRTSTSHDSIQAKVISSKQTSLKMKQDLSLKKKRGAHDICEVCGDRASGYHYNALTCEGCKGFFRRAINRKDIPYSCKFGGKCEMDTYTRRKCPDCRLKKCKAVGMLEECLLTEIQCQSKRRSRKRKVSGSKRAGEQNKADISHEPVTNSSQKQENECDQTNAEKSEKQSSSEENLVSLAGKAFLEYRTNPDIIKNWESFMKKSATNRKANFCEMSTIHVRVLVEFTKKLPGFLRLDAEDQISLLKGSVVEIMLLRNACGYNLKKGELDISAVVKHTGVDERHFRAILDFFSRIDSLGLNDTEYGLLSAVILFDSDHSHTQDKDKIDKCRDAYLAAIKTYSNRRQPKRNQILPKMIDLITQLRSLYDLHTKMVKNFQKRQPLSPLLCEIWDLG